MSAFNSDDLINYFGDEKSSDSICSLYTSYMNHLMFFTEVVSRLSDKAIVLSEYYDSIKLDS